MASIDAFKVRAVIEAGYDKNSLRRANNEISASFAGMNNKMAKVSAVAASAQTNFMMVGAAIAASFAAGVGAAASFEEQFVRVKKTLDVSGDAKQVERAFEGISKRLRDLTKLSPVTTDVITEIAAVGGQLGIASKDIVQFTNTIQKLTIATNLSAENAAMAMSRLQEITGTQTSELDNLGSSLVALGNNFAAQESEITTAALQIATSTAQISGSMNNAAVDALAFSTALKAIGQPSQAGATAIVRLMSELSEAVTEGGSKLALFAKVARMSEDSFVSLFGIDSTQAVAKFIEGLDSVNSLGITNISVLSQLGLGQVRTQKAILSLAKAHDTLYDAIDTSNRAYIENNALNEEAERRYDTLFSELQKGRNLLKGEFIDFGLDNLNGAKNIVSDINNFLFGVVSNLVDTVKRFTRIITIGTVFFSVVRGISVSMRAVNTEAGLLVGTLQRANLASAALGRNLKITGNVMGANLIGEKGEGLLGLQTFSRLSGQQGLPFNTLAPTMMERIMPGRYDKRIMSTMQMPSVLSMIYGGAVPDDVAIDETGRLKVQSGIEDLKSSRTFVVDSEGQATVKPGANPQQIEDLKKGVRFQQDPFMAFSEQKMSGSMRRFKPTMASRGYLSFLKNSSKLSVKAGDGVQFLANKLGKQIKAESKLGTTIMNTNHKLLTRTKLQENLIRFSKGVRAKGKGFSQVLDTELEGLMGEDFKQFNKRGRRKIRKGALQGNIKVFNERVEAIKANIDKTGEATMADLQLLEAVEKGTGSLGRFKNAIKGVSLAIGKLAGMMIVFQMFFKTVEKIGAQARGIEEFNNKLKETAQALTEVAEISKQVADINTIISDLQNEGAAQSVIDVAMEKQTQLLLQQRNLREQLAGDIGQGFLTDIVEGSFGNNKGGILEFLIPAIGKATSRSQDDIRRDLGAAFGEVVISAIDPENIAKNAGKLPTMDSIVESLLFSGQTFTNNQTKQTIKVPSSAFKNVSGGILMAIQEQVGSDVSGADVMKMIGLDEIFTPGKIGELTQGLSKGMDSVAGGFDKVILKAFKRGSSAKVGSQYEKAIIDTMLAVSDVVGDEFSDVDIMTFAMDYVNAMAMIQGATGDYIDSLGELDPNSPLANTIKSFVKDRLQEFRDTDAVTQEQINRAGNDYQKLTKLYSQVYTQYQKSSQAGINQLKQDLNISLSAQEKILKRMQDNFKQTRQSLLDLASPLPGNAFEGLSELEIFFNTVKKAASQQELERVTQLLRDFGKPVLATELAKGGPGSLEMAKTYLNNPQIASAQEMQMRAILGPELAEEDYGITAESQQELANQQGFDIGQNIAGGILKGFKDSEEALQDLFSGVLKNSIMDGISWLGIKSPSRWMITNVGTPIIEGVMFGIKQAQPDLERVFYDTLDQSFKNVPLANLPDLTATSSGVSLDYSKLANMIANKSNFAGTMDFAVAFLKSLPIEMEKLLSQMADLIAKSMDKAMTRMQEAFSMITRITQAERAQTEQAKNLIRTKQDYAAVLRREATLSERMAKVKEELNELELTGMKGNIDITERIGVLQQELDLEDRRRRLNKDFTAREQLDIQAKQREVAELGRMADLGVVDALEYQAAKDELDDMQGNFDSDAEKELFLLEYAQAMDEKERYEKEILEIHPDLVTKREEYIGLLNEQDLISLDVQAGANAIAEAEERVAAGVMEVEAAYRNYAANAGEYQKEIEIVGDAFDFVNDRVKEVIDSVYHITDPNNFDFSSMRTHISSLVDDLGEYYFVKDQVDKMMENAGLDSFRTMFNQQANQSRSGDQNARNYFLSQGGFDIDRFPTLSGAMRDGFDPTEIASNISQNEQYFEDPTLSTARFAGGAPASFSSTSQTGNYAQAMVDFVNSLGVGTTESDGRVYFSIQNAEAIAKGMSADLAQAGLTPMEFEPYMELLTANKGNLRTGANTIYTGPNKNTTVADDTDDDIGGGGTPPGTAGAPINYAGGRASTTSLYNTGNYGTISGGVLNTINDIVNGTTSVSSITQDMRDIIDRIDPNILKGGGTRVQLPHDTSYASSYIPGSFKFGGRVPDMTNIKPKKYAMGGRDNLMRRALVGEYGPEEVRFVPGSGFLVKPLTEGGRGNNTIVENLSVNVTGVPSDPSSARKAALEIRKALNRLDKEGNTGGGVARR